MIDCFGNFAGENFVEVGFLEDSRAGVAVGFPAGAGAFADFVREKGQISISHLVVAGFRWFICVFDRSITCHLCVD